MQLCSVRYVHYVVYRHVEVSIHCPSNQVRSYLHLYVPCSWYRSIWKCLYHQQQHSALCAGGGGVWWCAGVGFRILLGSEQRYIMGWGQIPSQNRGWEFQDPNHDNVIMHFRPPGWTWPVSPFQQTPLLWSVTIVIYKRLWMNWPLPNEIDIIPPTRSDYWSSNEHLLFTECDKFPEMHLILYL